MQRLQPTTRTSAPSCTCADHHHSRLGHVYVTCRGQLHLASNAGLMFRPFTQRYFCTGCAIGSGEGMMRGMRTQRLSKSKQVSKLAHASAAGKQVNMYMRVNRYIMPQLRVQVYAYTYLLSLCVHIPPSTPAPESTNIAQPVQKPPRVQMPCLRRLPDAASST